ncbi:DUF7488 domain-containing protein [Helicobacter felis]|uniref:DUF7488 domain-containing protein n=1 Tax=Helicobacter felis TaxID=214 RepID=UPI000CEE2A50|nr:PDZ domain-containing protein [Helicobacter felis]
MPLGAYNFSQCVRYHHLATRGDSLSLEWQKHQVAFLRSLTPPKGVKILKADPFMGFYLINAPKTRFAYHLLDMDSRAYRYPLASVKQDALLGKILERQKGFLDFAKFSAPVPTNAVVSNICYQIYGIGVGGHSFIETKYLKRFLAQKTPYYGDIGVRVGEGMVVERIDPFFANNPFVERDVIISINGEHIANPNAFEWVVSNLTYGSLAHISIRRGDTLKEFKVKVGRRYGGFLLPDTFLERFGIVLDDKLTITQARHLRYPLNVLRVGDRIKWINKRPVLVNWLPPHRALQRALSAASMQGYIEMLILRKGLEVYVRL